MNILSINALSAQSTFKARKPEGAKSANTDAIQLLKDKIKYAEKRLASEEEYLTKEVRSYKERQYVEVTIMRLRNELEGYRKAFAKAVAKKI